MRAAEQASHSVHACTRYAAVQPAAHVWEWPHNIATHPKPQQAVDKDTEPHDVCTNAKDGGSCAPPKKLKGVEGFSSLGAGAVSCGLGPAQDC